MMLAMGIAHVAKSQLNFDSLLRIKPVLQAVADNAKQHRLQIIYTRITRNNKGEPSFRHEYYHVDSSNYFYCASLVKLPTCILALEKLRELHISRAAIMFTDSAGPCQRSVRKDTTSQSRYPSIEHYIKKMCLVSDNHAFGRAYEFVGVDYMHARLSQLGFPNIRIIHRFDGGCKGTENTTTNPVSFYNPDMTLLYRQPQAVSKTYAHPLGQVYVGKAYHNAQNKRINEPKNFTAMNYISLKDIHELLRRLIFNNSLGQDKQLSLAEDDRQFLVRYLTMYPRESDYPAYDPKPYYDSYKKYFIFGDSKAPITDTTIRITNIVGQSYGFMVDCAYITNKQAGVEFMLSAVIYANADEVINDGRYEYNTVALPFLAELGRQVYSYELRRHRQ